jgi:hypothetical protein
MAHYSRDFTSGPHSRESWKSSKARLFEREGSIGVEIAEVVVRQDAEGDATIRFIQRYTAETHSDAGLKTMHWREEAAGWKIVAECWRELPKRKGEPVKAAVENGLPAKEL